MNSEGQSNSGGQIFTISILPMIASDTSIEKINLDVSKDTPPEMTDIKSQIDALKKQNDDLQKDMDDFEKSKSSLSKEIIDQKQKEFEQKGLDIEKKKQEILDRIKTTRTELGTLKGDILKTSTHELDAYEKEVQAIVVKKGFWEKVKETPAKVRERAKEHKKGLLIASGVGILIRGINHRLKKRKEKKEGKASKEKNSGRKRLLTRLGIGAGGFLLYKNRDKISNRFSGLFGKETPPPLKPNQAESFESLSSELQAKYYTLGDDVDTYTSTINPQSIATLSTDEQENRGIKASMLWGLDKETKNLDQFSTNDTLNYVTNETTDGIMEKIGNRTKDRICSLFGGVLSTLTSFKSFLPNFITSPFESIQEWLKKSSPEERERVLSASYKEYINTIKYISEKKELLKEALAKEKIMTKAHIKDTPTADQKVAIDELLESSDWEKEMTTFFQKHSLSDIPGLLKEYTIENTDVSKERGELLHDLKEEKDEILNTDDKGETAITRAEAAFLAGSLDKDSKAELTTMCQKFLDTEFGDSSKSLFGAYTHLITDIFAGNTELAENFMKQPKIEEVQIERKKAFTEAIQKLKDGSFTQTDLSYIKTQTEVYFKTKTDYNEAVLSMEKMNKGLHPDRWKAANLPLNAVKDIGKALGKGKTNSWRERVGYGLGGCYVAGQTLYVTSKLIPSNSPLLLKMMKPITGLSGKLGIEIGKLPITLGSEGLKLLTGRTHLTSIGWRRYIRTADHLQPQEKEALLKYAFLNGEISDGDALSVARHLGKTQGLNMYAPGENTITVDNLYARRGLKDPKELALFKKYKENSNLKKLLVKIDKNEHLRFRQNIKYTFFDRVLKKQVGFDPDVLKELQKIDESITKFPINSSKALFWKSFLENTKTLSNVDNLIHADVQGYTPEIANQLMRIRNINGAKNVADISTKAKPFGNLYTFGDDENDLTRRILHERNTKEGTDYFTNTKKITEAKAYAQEIMKTKNIPDAKTLGSIMGKNMSKFTSEAEFKKYLSFLTNNEKNITNYETFIRNSASKRATISELKDATAQAKYIESGNLNTTFFERRINAMKSNFKKSAETLRNLVKEKKTPYPGPVSKTAENLDKIANADNETLSAMEVAQDIGEGNRAMKMSKDSKLLNNLLPLFDDKEFVKQLAKTKNPEEIKNLFKAKSITTEIPDEFITSLAKSSSTRKAKDLMTYVSKYNEAQTIRNFLRNPSMKYASRVFGRTLGVVGFGLTAYSAVNKFNEADEIAETNLERGNTKRTDAYFESGYAVAFGVEALGSFGALAGVESACAFVPGIGRVIGGVILGASYVVKDIVFESLDKYNLNYKDMMKQAPLLIREHIITTTLGGAEEDRGFGDWLITTFKNNEYLAKKTGSEGIKALLYTEEWKKNPLAMLNIQDTDLMNKYIKEGHPNIRDEVSQALTLAENNVNAKYEYLKKKCGVYRLGGQDYIDIKKILTVDKIKKGEGLNILDRLLLESEYSLSNPDAFGDPQKIETYQKETKQKLDQDKKSFTTLEIAFTKDPKSLLYMYRYLSDYQQHLDQFSHDETGKCIEEKYDTIVKNMAYFNDYMSYKTLEQGIDVIQATQGFVSPNLITTRNFFADFASSSAISDKELYHSSSKLQTILFRIATEVIGAKTENTMDELKKVFSEENEKMYGIYFHDGKLDVNGNYFTDAEYAGNDVSTIKKIRADVQEQIKDGDLIDIGTGDSYLNQEIGNKYLRIIDQELGRT